MVGKLTMAGRENLIVNRWLFGAVSLRAAANFFLPAPTQ